MFSFSAVHNSQLFLRQVLESDISDHCMIQRNACNWTTPVGLFSV